MRWLNSPGRIVKNYARAEYMLSAIRASCPSNMLGSFRLQPLLCPLTSHMGAVDKLDSRPFEVQFEVRSVATDHSPSLRSVVPNVEHSRALSIAK